MKNNIYYERIKNNLSQRKLGQVIGVTESYISYLENGQRVGSVEVRYKLEDYFKKSARYLFDTSSEVEEVEVCE